MRYLSIIVLVLPGALSCTHTVAQARANTAEGLYAQGIEDLEDSLYPEAVKEFGEVKTKYPYTRFAALSELRIGDAHFRRAKYQEAIDTYRNFLKFHPNHDQADYAMFRIGESYFEQIPADWPFLPPGEEKDQGAARMGIAAYQDFLSRFPEGPTADIAREHLAGCRRKLADHEMYVARFYFSRDRYPAAALRAEGLLHDYGGLGLDDEALWIAGKSRFEQGDREAAEQHLGRLIKEFGNSAHAQDARSLLQTTANSPQMAPVGPKT